MPMRYLDYSAHCHAHAAEPVSRRSDSASVSPEWAARCDSLDWMKTSPMTALSVPAHTRDVERNGMSSSVVVGNQSAILRLGRVAVNVSRGFNAGLIEAVGRGEREPAVPTADDVDEPRNRRVEILVR
jgi:hypothetical protein